MGLHQVQLCLLLDLGNQDKTIGTLRSKDDDGSENAALKVMAKKCTGKAHDACAKLLFCLTNLLLF